MPARPNTRATPDAPQTPSEPATGTAAAAAPEFDWGTLAAPVPMPERKPFQGVKVFVVNTVPEPIRVRAELSLAVNQKKVADKTDSSASRKRVDYHWDVQPVATSRMGEKFSQLIVKYSKYRPSDAPIPHAHPDSPKGQVTARVGTPMHYVNTGDTEPQACDATTEGAYLGVRYSVRPFERRNSTARLPGTA